MNSKLQRMGNMTRGSRRQSGHSSGKSGEAVNHKIAMSCRMAGSDTATGSKDSFRPAPAAGGFRVSTIERANIPLW